MYIIYLSDKSRRFIMNYDALQLLMASMQQIKFRQAFRIMN